MQNFTSFAKRRPEVLAVILLAIIAIIVALILPQFDNAFGGTGAFIAAIVASFLLSKTSEQNEMLVQSRYDAQKPILLPTERLVGKITDLGFDNTRIELKIHNAGPGIAFNVQATLYEPQRTDILERHYTALQTGIPLLSGQISMIELPLGVMSVSGTATINKQTLAPPPAPKSTSLITLDGFPSMARLTLTYADMFGRKHFAMYDLLFNATWQLVEIDTANASINDLIGQHEKRQAQAMRRGWVSDLR